MKKQCRHFVVKVFTIFWISSTSTTCLGFDIRSLGETGSSIIPKVSHLSLRHGVMPAIGRRLHIIIIGHLCCRGFLNFVGIGFVGTLFLEVVLSMNTCLIVLIHGVYYKLNSWNLPATLVLATMSSMKIDNVFTMSRSMHESLMCIASNGLEY